MTTLRIQTSSRLHFGLLGWGPSAPRQFGGAGLMIDAPGIELIAEPAAAWSAEGPLAERALEIAERVAAQLAAGGQPLRPARIRVVRAPEEHAGLGVGTQLNLAVTRVLATLAGLVDPSVADLAGLCGRGRRSGIGVHGFARGGLIVDGGRRNAGGIPPLLAHVDLPASWWVLVVLSNHLAGLHGPAEIQAFADLPPAPAALTDRLCRLVLLGLLPAAIECDLPAFGQALTEIQLDVGKCFSPAQGGVFAHPELDRVAEHLRMLGLHGVGQSSWGPTLYGFSEAAAADRWLLLKSVRERFALDENAAFWTTPSRHGAVLERVSE